jgi:hypothetical protein
MTEKDMINAVLLALVTDRVKAECSKMLEAGATAEQVNNVLPDILAHYTQWQKDALARCLFDLERPLPPASGTLLRPN